MLKIGVVGLGYFSGFHMRAWSAQDVTLIGGVDPDKARREWAVADFELPVFEELNEMLALGPDVVDIIAPPLAHKRLIEACASKGRILICQKPFCTSIEEAERCVALAAERGCTLIIHENFRFQPWHRTIKAVLDSGRLGQVFAARFNLRPGDGRGPEAYLERQPVFQTMPRLLIHETGVHFVDLFRWMFGEVSAVYADLVRLNPVITGEDAGLLVLTHENGARSVFDGNRLMDHVTDNPRRTMGEMWIEGEGGVLRLDGAGCVAFRGFGCSDWEPVPLAAEVDDSVFGGGCVAALIDHVVRGATSGQFENEAAEYLGVVRIVEAAYRSAQTGRRIAL